MFPLSKSARMALNGILKFHITQYNKTQDKVIGYK